MRHLRIGVIGASCLVALAAAASAAASVPLPVAGSTAPSADVVVRFPEGMTITAARGWLVAGIVAREATVAALTTTVASAKSLTPSDRVELGGILSSTATTLGALGTSAPNVPTVAQAQGQLDTMVGLHVFAELTPLIAEVTKADDLTSSIAGLVAQETSISAAIAATIGTKTRSRAFASFRADLAKAQRLVAPLAARAYATRSKAPNRAISGLAAVAAGLTTVSSLVSAAETAEQTIVASLASARLRRA